MVLGVGTGIVLLSILSKMSLREIARVFIMKNTIELALICYGAMMLRGVSVQ